MTGVELIAKERQRQIEEEGWSIERDLIVHPNGELALAGASYALVTIHRYEMMSQKCWPWDWKWYKPTPDDKVRQLAKAGALIAAEIDRIQRQREAKCVTNQNRT